MLSKKIPMSNLRLTINVKQMNLTLLEELEIRKRIIDRGAMPKVIENTENNFEAVDLDDNKLIHVGYRMNLQQLECEVVTDGKSE